MGVRLRGALDEALVRKARRHPRVRTQCGGSSFRPHRRRPHPVHGAPAADERTRRAWQDAHRCVVADDRADQLARAHRVPDAETPGGATAHRGRLIACRRPCCRLVRRQRDDRRRGPGPRPPLHPCRPQRRRCDRDAATTWAGCSSPRPERLTGTPPHSAAAGPAVRVGRVAVHNAAVSGPLGLVGSGEFTPATEAVDIALLEGREQRVVFLPTAAALEGAKRTSYWVELGRTHYRRLDVEAWLGGAAVAGCSAGAIALAERVPDIRRRGEPSVPGFGLARGLAVLPHFDQIDRWRPGASEWFVEHTPPGVHVIGIDEDTAMVGGPTHWRVMGRGSVWILGPGERIRHGDGAAFSIA